MDDNTMDPGAVLAVDQIEQQSIARSVAKIRAYDHEADKLAPFFTPEEQFSIYNKMNELGSKHSYRRIDAEQNCIRLWDEGCAAGVFDAEIEQARARRDAAESTVLQHMTTAGMKQYLTAAYRDPVVAQQRRQPFSSTDEEPMFPG